MSIHEPQNIRSAKTRAAVLDAAWDLLEKSGPEGTTMTAVADAAGVSRRGLYLHFASRTQLLIAVIDHRNQTLDLDASIRPVFDAPDALTALNEWVRHLTDYHPRIRPVVEAVNRARSLDADADAMWEEAMAGWRQGCRHVARHLEQEGKLAAGWTVASATDALWSLMVAFNDLRHSLVEERSWSPKEFSLFLARLHKATFLA
jgi:AcrR family transcriptional regulator